jgi:hypothetical protein
MEIILVIFKLDFLLLFILFNFKGLNNIIIVTYMDIDPDCKIVLNTVGINFNNITELEGYFFPREQLLLDTKYDEVKKYIPELKKKFSSSFMTSLQKKAEIQQKWPLINLIRQILSVYKYNLEPIRKCDGYTSDGVKKFKRYFKIVRKNS